MSHPDARPDLFLDRSLGRIQVPRLLRAAGLRLDAIAQACADDSGPFIYAVHATRIERLPLDDA